MFGMYKTNSSSNDWEDVCLMLSDLAVQVRLYLLLTLNKFIMKSFLV